MLKQITTAAAALLLAMPGYMAETAPKTGTWDPDHQRLWHWRLPAPAPLSGSTPLPASLTTPPWDIMLTTTRATLSSWSARTMPRILMRWIGLTTTLTPSATRQSHLIQDCADGVRADGRLSPLGSTDQRFCGLC